MTRPIKKKNIYIYHGHIRQGGTNLSRDILDLTRDIQGQTRDIQGQCRDNQGQVVKFSNYKVQHFFLLFNLINVT